MDFYEGFRLLSLAIGVFLFFLSMKVLILFWVSPNLAYRKLRGRGFGGPSPTFPLGNIGEMKKKPIISLGSKITHDIHSTVFPYFARWQKAYGKTFVYWLGTEPFLYVADPEFLKKMSAAVVAKGWGKPNVFKHDRKPMFGNGLVMTEGEEWVRHRHAIIPAFNPINLKAMASVMVESATEMLNRWDTLMSSGKAEIDVEREIIMTAGEIIARTSFGINCQSGREVFEKLRALQMTLFKTNRFVGVPFNKIMDPAKSLEAQRLGAEIDKIFLSIISERRKTMKRNEGQSHQNLLGMLLEENQAGKRTLSTAELVDECKTFFYGGHETTGLTLSWTLLLLALNPEWQDILREEIKEVIGDEEIDFNKLSGLKKMGWVMNEVLRLYPTAPNVQRQARGEIQVDGLIIPKGTNLWIDVVGLHHDKELWGEGVNQFRPERFKDDINGGCKHKMGYLPFGFGGRMCIGRNLTFMEYKIVLTLILSRFSFTVSPTYSHSPAIMLSLRPSEGLLLVVHRL